MKNEIKNNYLEVIFKAGSKTETIPLSNLFDWYKKQDDTEIEICNKHIDDLNSNDIDLICKENCNADGFNTFEIKEIA